MREDALLTGTLEPTNEPYAIAKIAGIKMCESYNLQYGTNFISVMPTNLYGPNDGFDLEKSHVLPAMLRKMHLGKALEENDWDAIRTDLNKLPIEGIDGNTSKGQILSVLDKYGIKIVPNSELRTPNPEVSVEIWGSGNPRREFLWSEDMADACVFLMENRDFVDLINDDSENNEPLTDGKLCDTPVPQSSNSEIRNTHINIGTGVDISIRELAETIKKIIGFGGDLYFNTDKPDGTLLKLTDPSKLHKLGWQHSVELRDGIEKMYDWYKAHNK
jgi:GDP-L-fucose synthase